MKKTISCIFIFIILISMCGCSAKKEIGQSYFAFNTYMAISVYSEKNEKESESDLRQIKSYIDELENTLSVTKDSSEVFEINRDGGRVGLSEAITELLLLSKQAYEKTEGAFDISSFPYTSAWGFTTGENRVPSKEELEINRDSVGFCKIDFDENMITLPSNGKIDFGGIAKGYLGDELARKLKEDGYENAILTLGGNIRVIGKKPDGSLWKIGIADPDNPSFVMGYVSVSDTNVVTSGGYERNFVGEDGVTYCHIIDPKTGFPVDNGIKSVTVIGENGALCDAYSTGLYVMGAEKASSLYSLLEGFEYIIVTKDEGILITEGIAPFFTNQSKYRVMEIKKRNEE